MVLAITSLSGLKVYGKRQTVYSMKNFMLYRLVPIEHKRGLHGSEGNEKNKIPSWSFFGVIPMASTSRTHTSFNGYYKMQKIFVVTDGFWIDTPM